MYCNTVNKKKTSIPRHPNIVEFTVFDICKQLGVPKPEIN